MSKEEENKDKELVWKKLSEPYRPPRLASHNVAIGYNARSTGNNSIAIGRNATAYTGRIAIGSKPV